MISNHGRAVNAGPGQKRIAIFPTWAPLSIQLSVSGASANEDAAAGVEIGIVPESLATVVPPGAVVRPIKGLAARHCTELLQREGKPDAIVAKFVDICRAVSRDLQRDVRRAFGAGARSVPRAVSRTPPKRRSRPRA